MTTTVPLADEGTTTSLPARTLSICLINPRFEPSYLGFEYALPLYPGDKRSTMISFVSVKEEFFDGLCDVMFVGEAETTWPQFLDDYARGQPTQKRYKQTAQTDMTKAVRPRYDLLKVDRYASGALQYSRGCPFQCEFCDIIVIYGRRPRVKHPEQLVAELDDMRRAGFKSAFIVDDNFIGDKKKAKALLNQIIPWMQQHDYPLRLTTEASVNLADDAELLELMYQANFRSVFIGIETPREASLQETKKYQNIRGDSLDAKLLRIQNAGLDINAGFIVGFDSDDKAIFDDQFRFIQDNGITLAMVGMLQAIPTTPLYERLERDGRLVEEDTDCNFVPKQMSREELREGYWNLVKRLYTPQAFLDRYFKVYQLPEYLKRRAEMCQKAGEGKRLSTLSYGLALLWSLFWTLCRDGSLISVGKVYVNYFFTRNLRYRRDIVGFAQFVNRCVTHWHFYKFTRELTSGRLRNYNNG